MSLSVVRRPVARFKLVAAFSLIIGCAPDRPGEIYAPIIDPESGWAAIFATDWDPGFLTAPQVLLFITDEPDQSQFEVRGAALYASKSPCVTGNWIESGHFLVRYRDATNIDLRSGGELPVVSIIYDSTIPDEDCLVAPVRIETSWFN
ncbi:hypothetical protein [Parvularcula dongshanensis]|uniref:Lipoprotein n=1 Tax=Parvularcula dongshanensis TaxID=1173995 RepID=A0A840I1Q0_9PROT|nr:hypothetical protein [Parvularcula dongshanensis]MBB4658164.1 hypothetical protein [Parvularcula dongshanensis]